MNIIFGTDGWRGLLGTEVNADSMSAAAQAFADYLNENYDNPGAVIGYDGREGSKIFADIFGGILNGNSIRTFISSCIIPTPVLSFGVKHLGVSAGVMITASHNPPKYNGVKFKGSYGGPFFTEQTHEVEKYLYKSEVKSSSKGIIYTDLLTPYRKQIESLVDLDLIMNAGINVLIDSMGGAGQRIIEDILNEHGIMCRSIFSTAAFDFMGRNAEPIEKNLAPLSEELASGEYSFGAATDGDADRAGFMLENGEWLSAQYTIAMLADYIINCREYEGKVVKTSSVTDKLQLMFGKERTEEVQVGFKYICEAMLNKKAAIGCEESGGYGYGSHIPERDGILSVLYFMEMLASSGHKKLSRYFEIFKDRYGSIFYDRIDHPYEKNNRTEILPRIAAERLERAAGYMIEKTEFFYSSRGIINGIKFTLEGNPRWLLLRASETEPLVRIYAEAESDSEVDNLLAYGKLFFR